MSGCWKCTGYSYSIYIGTTPAAMSFREPSRFPIARRAFFVVQCRSPSTVVHVSQPPPRRHSGRKHLELKIEDTRSTSKEVYVQYEISTVITQSMQRQRQRDTATNARVCGQNPGRWCRRCTGRMYHLACTTRTGGFNATEYRNFPCQRPGGR